MADLVPERLGPALEPGVGFGEISEGWRVL
jgi:hypothetical protein